MVNYCFLMLERVRLIIERNDCSHEVLVQVKYIVKHYHKKVNVELK